MQIRHQNLKRVGERVVLFVFLLVMQGRSYHGGEWLRMKRHWWNFGLGRMREEYKRGALWGNGGK